MMLAFTCCLRNARIFKDTDGGACVVVAIRCGSWIFLVWFGFLRKLAIVGSLGFGVEI